MTKAQRIGGVSRFGRASACPRGEMLPTQPPDMCRTCRKQVRGATIDSKYDQTP
jgi:hypothetical protein